MRVTRVHIRNLKTIPDLDFRFQRDLTLLYGNNGVGKTTILEAVSLIGHLSSMQRICLADGSVQRLLSVSAGSLGLPESLSPAFDPVVSQLTGKRLSDWFDQFSLQNASAIYYELCHEPNSQLPVEPDRNPLGFCVVFVKSDLSFTRALSRKSSADSQMAERFAVIFEKKEDAAISALIDHTFLVASHSTQSALHPKKDQDGRSIVTYINTDLNDFGRKNDVRESVKDLVADLKPEIIDRLALKFDGQTHSFSFLEKLNEAAGSVIQDYSNFDPLSDGDEPLFKISQLTYESASGIALRVKRRGMPEEAPDYMSAGENECSFCFSSCSD